VYFDVSRTFYITYILALYVDDMFIAAKSKKEITTLNAYLKTEFDMKDLGAAKKVLGSRYGKVCYFLVSTVILTKFFIVLICLMQNVLVHQYLHTSNCPLLNVQVLMKILRTCHELHILVFLVL
jgi:hypothetical protein